MPALYKSSKPRYTSLPVSVIAIPKLGELDPVSYVGSVPSDLWTATNCCKSSSFGLFVNPMIALFKSVESGDTLKIRLNL